MERHLDVEVVVEAVGDRRPDAELGVREQLLHGLGHHVRGRVPQDVAAVGGVDRDRLDHGTVGQLVREVAQLAVDPGRDHAGVVGEQLPRLRARRHGPLSTLVCAGDDDFEVGHWGSFVLGRSR